MSTSSDTKDREAKVGDTVRLVCDGIPGLEEENIPTKGMLVIVSETYGGGTIHVNREWAKTDGSIYGGCRVIMAFERDDYEVLEEEIKIEEPSADDLKEATQSILALLEKLNG